MAKMEVLFKPGDSAWIIEREEAHTVQDCRSRLHSSFGCPHCGGSGKITRRERTGPWQRAAVRVDAIAWDYDGITYFTNGGWQGGTERKDRDLFLTEEVAKAVADKRNEEEGK